MAKRLTLVLVAALLLGGLLGGAIGFYAGVHKGAAAIIDRSLGKDARSVQTLVETLRHLRAGRSAEALGLVEHHLEDTLVLFDPAEPYPGLSARTRAALEEAVAAAREYRAEHRRVAPRPAIDPMVDNLLGEPPR